MQCVTLATCSTRQRARLSGGGSLWEAASSLCMETLDGEGARGLGLKWRYEEMGQDTKGWATATASPAEKKLSCILEPFFGNEND